ncbi:unnamed protein product [Gongylonema pulchrum]|uniref:Ovule protein n=1 Tax=Gongylonema pulchrum TaxID=637853 RepID=A0A183EL65_9BILA|nr:unnamed protein product [Gongylonema pulchrum]
MLDSSHAEPLLVDTFPNSDGPPAATLSSPGHPQSPQISSSKLIARSLMSSQQPKESDWFQHIVSLLISCAFLIMLRLRKQTFISLGCILNWDGLNYDSERECLSYSLFLENLSC